RLEMKMYLQKMLGILSDVMRDSFRVTIYPHRIETDVNGYDSLVWKVSKKYSMDRRDVRSILALHVGNYLVKDLLTEMFSFLPSKPIKTGDNWVRNFVLVQKAPVKYSNMFVVKEIKDDIVTLQVETVISAKTGEGGSVYEAGKRTGTILVHRTSGIPISWNSTEKTIYKTNYDTLIRSQTITGRRS
ncbi:MAG TPA: DUF6263 family protein, partial [Flavitalea sp.]|nr:DUF6263 family protein [Flavitalea sp.]